MTVAFGLGLNRKQQALVELDETPGLFLGPIDSLVSRAQVGGIVAKVVAIDGFVARRGDNADLLDPAVEGFLRDDLEHGLGEPVAVDQGQHRFLHGVGRRVLPRPRPAAVITAFEICTAPSSLIGTLALSPLRTQTTESKRVPPLCTG